jgi:hypothetical protein
VTVTLHDFLTDERLVGHVLGAPSFRAHRVIARLLDGDAHLLSPEDRALATELTGRTEFPTVPVAVATILASRRTGKTVLAGATGVYHAAQDYRDRLAPGEWATIGIAAPNMRQAQTLIDYCWGFVEQSPVLRAAAVRATSTVIEFEHRTRIEVFGASHRTLRGYTFASFTIDEAAQLRDEESATPDVELKRAIMPALATLGGRLLVISSPYMRRGLIYDAYRDHYGRNDTDHLVVKAPWHLMNPTLPQATIDAALADDAESARSEWFAEFRTDLSAAFDPDKLEAAVETGLLVRPPLRQPGTEHLFRYHGFCDPAGGSGRDSYTATVAHAEGTDVLLDAVLEIRPPFSTDDASARVANFLKPYGITQVTADRYAGDWPSQSLAKHGIQCIPSERDKSKLYLEAIPLFSSGRVRLLDHPRMLAQFRNLERRVRSGTHDRIDCPGGMSDDISNACAGALVLASKRPDAGSLLWSCQSEQSILTQVELGWHRNERFF